MADGSGRLRGLRPGDLDPQQKAVYDEIAGGRRASGPQLFELRDGDGVLHGPFNAMVLAPAVGLHLQRLGSALRYETTLPAPARELAILLCARAERSDFEWYAHAPIAAAAGVPDAAVQAIYDGEVPVLDDAVEQAVVAMTSSILRDGNVPDDMYRSVSEVLSEVQLVELAVLVGYYRLLSGLLRTFRIPLPEGVTAPFAIEAGGGSSSV